MLFHLTDAALLSDSHDGKRWWKQNLRFGLAEVWAQNCPRVEGVIVNRKEAEIVSS